ncbi:MAG: hypothetical protein P8Y45_16190 [Exilibacterium sp.]
MKTYIAVVCVFISGLSYGHDTESSKQELFRLMNHTSVNEIQLTPEEAIERSDAIVKGKIFSITEGRSIKRNVKSTARPTETALIKVEVSEVIKGDVGNYIYLEYIRGGIPAEYLDQNKYPDEMLLLLRNADHMWPPGDYVFMNSPNGLMSEVDTLYVLTSQRGLIVAPTNGGSGTTVVQPLDQTDAPYFKEGSTLIDAENYLKFTAEDLGKMFSPSLEKEKSGTEK